MTTRKPHPIRLARKAQKMSLREMSEQIGVTHMTLHRWEKGQRLPRAKDWAAIETVTGVTPAQLVEFKAAVEAGTLEPA